MGTPQTEVYRGTVLTQYHNRNITGYEKFWNKEATLGVGKFDTLLLQQFLHAEAQGRGNVTLVDIGSGSGGLMTSFLANLRYAGQTDLPEELQLAPEATRYLQTHPEMHLRMIGLTDAKAPFQFNTRTNLSNTWTRHPQVTAENVYFSLTKDQTYAEFLRENDIDETHLTVAVFSLPYFHPFLFRDTVETAITSLGEGGVFVGAPYGHEVLYPLSAYTPRKNDAQSHGPLKRLMNTLENAKLSQTHEEFSRTLPEVTTRFIQIATRLGRVTHISPEEYVNKLQQHPTPALGVHNESRNLEDDLNDQKARVLKDHKKRTLHELAEKYKDRVVSHIGEELFFIQRRATSHVTPTTIFEPGA